MVAGELSAVGIFLDAGREVLRRTRKMPIPRRRVAAVN